MTKRWEALFHELQQDFKLYLFLMALFTVFRVAFVLVMHKYLNPATTQEDLLTALEYGFRISLKSASVLVAVTFGLSTCLRTLVPAARLGKLRLSLGSLYVLLLSFLFYARIPYYEQFHMGFNQLVFNTMRDDVWALFVTLVQQYQLPLRLALIALTAAALCWLLKGWLEVRTFRLPVTSRWYVNIALRVLALWMFYQFSLYAVSGGSTGYADNFDWENAGITRDELLNEAILDDVQALYRAYILHDRLSASTGVDADQARMHEFASFVARRPVQGDDLDEYLSRHAEGAKVKKPRQVFLIIGESYANWPLLPEYKALGITAGMDKLIQQSDTAYVGSFLPNGLSTISGVMGIVSGLAEVNLYLTYLPESYKETFSTALAPQMKRLGYKTKFWYAGPSSWERVRDFVMAQGFDEFHSRGDVGGPSGNVWGCDDKDLFDTVEKNLNPQEDGFHVVLTVSNHSPYTVDLAAAGFPRQQVIDALPPDRKEDTELIRKLGHHWYADQMMTRFIKEMEEKYPDSLFVIVGDHADRVNVELNPTNFKRYAIPFIVHGKGVQKEMLPSDAAGSHINVGATLMELIAPRGFKYYTVGDSLTRGNAMGFNYGFWITAQHFGKICQEGSEALPDAKSTTQPPSVYQVYQEVEAQRAISWWRVKNGKQLP
ncbi:LTA synthase family protein [Azotosporobacter soli]|uniref:LTA synthase family protein n=1 Tax=Azotosporobacter soli TaxID=3055040 RepID=UPI0031FE7617